jgi:3-oxoacyl-[acyl-carrier protein] reductase
MEEGIMELGLKDKVVIVTGASRGIGKAIALGFASEGARLSVCARTPEPLKSAVGEFRALRAEVFARPTDLTQGREAEAFVQETLDKCGRIDVLVNNVGGSRWTATEEISDEEWHEILDWNLVSAARMSRAVVPQMKKQEGGAIIMISSIWGREGGGHITYNASKAAEISLAKSLARELAPHNIRVNSIAPGSILFPGSGWDRRQRSDPKGIAEFVKRDMPLGRFGKPEEIANVVVFLASERASLLTGACINVDGCQSKSNI